MYSPTFQGVSRFACRALLAALALAGPSAFAQTPPPASLTLGQALSRAAASDLVTPAARARVVGAEAGVRQAGRPPNPAVGVEVENFAGSGAYRGVRSAETTLFLQQVIELGNKRGARTGVASAELSATRARSAARLLDVLREVELAWVDAAAAASHLRLARERLIAAQNLQTEIARGSQAGRDPAYVQTRAEAQVALERIAVEQAEAAAQIARANLAAYWRGSADFDVSLDEFDLVASGDGASRYEAELAIAEAERQLAGARVGLERARAIPDPAVRVGVRRFNDSSDTAVVGGVSIPLPLFDTNRDAIAKAEAERRAAEIDVEAARRTLRRELNRLRGRLRASAEEARRVQSDVIPQAERALGLIREGLDRGAFSYVEFNDAQRMLNDARTRRIDALKTFHSDAAAVARLTGRRLGLIARKGTR